MASAVSAVALALALALALAGLVGASGCTLLTDFDKEIQKEDAGASALTSESEAALAGDEAAAARDRDNADDANADDANADDNAAARDRLGYPAH